MSSPLQDRDPEIYAAIVAETERQGSQLELIASENYASPAILEAVGSVLTDKYAEGYPGRRYYGGCQHVDVAEQVAIDRLKQLYGAEHANVQPHSGASANMAVFLAALKPGDPILALDLAHGGHLTHGMKLNFSGKLYDAHFYGVDRQTHRIDLDQVARLAREHRPKLLITGASAYPRLIDFAPFAEIAREVGALFLVDMAHISGLVAGGVHPSPVAHADFVTSTTHKTLRGPRGGIILCREAWAKKIDSAVFPGLQGGPLMHVIAGKAVCFGEALNPLFSAYTRQIVNNAQVLAEELLKGGVRLITGGTDNHQVLLDVTSKNLTGKIAESALGAAGITVNKNLIPFDERKPMDPSGIRLGTAAMTTRGLRDSEMRQVASWILRVCDHADEPQILATIRDEIQEFTHDYPLPSHELEASVAS